MRGRVRPPSPRRETRVHCFVMRRLTLAIVLTGLVAAAQGPAPDPASKLDPTRAAALANALRGARLFPANPRTGVASSAKLTGIAPPAGAPGVEACSVPLIEVPVNPDIDRGILHRLKPEALRMDNMPSVTLLPPCSKPGAAK